MAYASVWFKVGAFSGAAAVALGAFGYHGLQGAGTDPKLLQTWDTAARYHLMHSLALLVVPFAGMIKQQPLWAGRLFLTGIVLFSGSLYALVLSKNRSLGAITPIGGLCLIAGWIALGLGI
jgi:uncharacterized membrane protein YgdD (TMEM256/DUF423 family)